MSAANFSDAIALELTYEGGLVNHPKDPGGLTNWGITIPALTEYLGRQAVPADITGLTKGTASDAYHKIYWTAVRGDEVGPGLDLALLDEAINAGRGRAIQHLKQALRLNGVDRVFGDGTMSALKAVDPVDLIERIRLERVRFYQGLPTFPTFGVGWLRRVNGVSITATNWARRAAA